MVKFKFGTNTVPVLEVKKTNKKRKVPYGGMGQAILDFIKDNPGTNTATIFANVKGTSLHSMESYIWRMVNQTQTLRKEGKRPFSYYVNEGKAVAHKPASKTPRSTAILAYIHDNKGKRFSYGDISKATGIPYGSIFAEVGKLKLKGVIDDSFNTGGEQSEPVNSPKKSSSNVSIDAIEFLIWNYVKETRSTDILGFLTWLEKR